MKCEEVKRSHETAPPPFTKTIQMATVELPQKTFLVVYMGQNARDIGELPFRNI